MASEASNSNDGEQGPARRKRLLPVAIAVSLGLLAGGGAGAFAAGSLLPKPAAVAPATGSDDADEEHAEASDAGDDGEQAETTDDEEGSRDGAERGAGGATYLMENLVLNPAGTGGTRFLMVTVAFGVKDEAVAEAMKARDHEVRDEMLGVLGSKTVAQLASVATRDSLKIELRARVAGLFPRGSVKQVYFPQFVIQ